MDNIVAESEDVMINALNFGLPQTSQYITDRRFVNYFPSGSNVYAPNAGNKNIRFYISGDANQYLDLSSVRLFATLQNTDGTAKFLRPLGGLHSFFQRYRATVGGQMVQDIIEYNCHCELFKSFKSKDVNEMDEIESSANPSWDDDYHKYANGLNNFVDYTTSGATNAGGVATVDTSADHNEYGRLDFRPTRHTLSGIAGANGNMRLGHKPVCGLLESNYYLPLRFAPLGIGIASGYVRCIASGYASCIASGYLKISIIILILILLIIIITVVVQNRHIPSSSSSLSSSC